MGWHVGVLSFLLAAVCLAGCKKQSGVDASVPLQQSFHEAAPEVKQAVDAAVVKLKTGDYAEATRALSPVVSGKPLTAAQREAVGLALKQVNDAVAKNPTLDTKEMYDLRAKMFRAVDSGPRF